MGLSKDDLPESVGEALVETQGPQWLDQALERVAELEKSWNFETIEIPDHQGAGSLVVKVEDEEKEGVLKIPADAQSGCDEAAALKIWEDCNVPAVVMDDQETGVFLMDYIPSSDECRHVTPFQAFVLADLMHTPEANFDYSFPSLSANLKHRAKEAQLLHRDNAATQEEVSLAIRVTETLLRTQDHQELLHGDYRNENIIYASQGPIIIDPKPCLGDSLFDIALWAADTQNVEDVEVLFELVGNGAPRLAPWVWSLATLKDGLGSYVAKLLRPQALKWMDRNFRTIR